MIGAVTAPELVEGLFIISTAALGGLVAVAFTLRAVTRLFSVSAGRSG